MRETEKDWDSILKNATRKIILCYDRSDKQDWRFSLQGTLSRDKTYESVDRKHFDEIIVRDKVLNVDFLINFYCTNQWSWAEKVRGLIYDEVLVTRRGFERMEYPENLAEVMSRCKRSEYIPGMAMFLLTQNDERIRNGLGSDIALTSTGVGTNVGSLSDKFDFPVTLFRRTMLGYFEDFKNPTREEFLFALTMEGIIGNTDREKKAIEEAQLHC
ncbi:hypothetical protein ADU18_0067 [Cronobacter phage PBES 02]|uniref:Uncharacterized protein n=1 Tax=Cronobacter phage PBES 02 TaxID=1684115 RepID=A0A0K1YA24_9CAUD|nr:hypothetical protein ADU18_0067 [Cronobacter phage PBES 02]AKY03970.1 hypothetical protein ADU18_0067 [Cronobacter phage PBES 02]